MSNINPQSIDGTYPIAGQDNNSQGFRDNFTNTVNNFTFAAAELTDLQNNAVLKAALGSVGQTTVTNDMNYALLTHAQIKGSVETTALNLTVDGSNNFALNWESGHFQSVTITANSTLTSFGTWPAANYFTKLRLQVTVSGGTYTLTFPATVNITNNLSSVRGYTTGTTVSLAVGVYVFEFSTVNFGANVVIEDVLRNYDTEINPDFGNLYITGNASIAGNLLAGLSRFAAINSTPIGNASASTGAFTSLNVSGNVLATGLSVFGNTTIGLIDISGGQFHTVVGNITQTSSTIGGAVYINTTGNVLANGLSVFGNARVGLAGAVSGQFHTVVGNITQTSSGGAVYINTTGNVLAASVTTGALINNGNIIIADPIGAGSFGSNLTVKGTINYKTQDSANNFSVATTSKSLTLAPGGDQFLLLNITANCAIGYNNPMVRGHQTTVHVKNSAGGLAYVIVPNNNTTTGNAFIGLADGQVGQFIFTSYGTDAGNIMVTVTR